jgi:hypothetical protein
MLKSLRLITLGLALVASSMVYAADNMDISVNADSNIVHVAQFDVMPADVITPSFDTPATYALNDVNAYLTDILVFRDFRTIADSGGRLV